MCLVSFPKVLSTCVRNSDCVLRVFLSKTSFKLSSTWTVIKTSPLFTTDWMSHHAYLIVSTSPSLLGFNKARPYRYAPQVSLFQLQLNKACSEVCARTLTVFPPRGHSPSYESPSSVRASHSYLSCIRGFQSHHWCLQMVHEELFLQKVINISERRRACMRKSRCIRVPQLWTTGRKANSITPGNGREPRPFVVACLRWLGWRQMAC